MTSSSARTALVVGATGISGQAVAHHLKRQGWNTYGLSRRAAEGHPGVTSLQADLLDAGSVQEAVSAIRPEAVFVTAWQRRATEAENIAVNGAMVRNVIDAVEPLKSVRHVALMTGLKHYLGPFEDYGTQVSAETPFHEDEPRLDSPNFYYAQEDELFAGTQRIGATWSVHRAHTIVGFATGNAMNMALTLAAYASICRETGKPFVFPGSQTQWDGLTDVTDADLLAEQMVWAATSPAGADEAFNIANGDVFRWRWLWPRLAQMFGVEPVGYEDHPRPLQDRMGDAGAVWRRLAEKHDLVEPDVERVASWWHTDGDLGRDIECLTDMTKSRQSGFLGFRSTPDSFAHHIGRYRDAHIIP